jgi:predicted DsbA family dithiol-disulfide isomerase
MIRLDIISDVVCPWCYVGKSYLDRALETRADHPFAIEWHPFQLNPDMPPGGMDRRTYLEAKFGGKEGALKAYLPLVEHAKVAGVALNHDLIQTIPNSLDAHRLIHWAGLEGRQTPMVSALFRSYWTEGRDIGDADVLADVAEGVGLDRPMVLRLLQGDADRDAIRDRDSHARSRGISGVPTFIIANRHAVQGAQPTETWLKIIDEITENMKDFDDE